MSERVGRILDYTVLLGQLELYLGRPTCQASRLLDAAAKLIAKLEKMHHPWALKNRSWWESSAGPGSVGSVRRWGRPPILGLGQGWARSEAPDLALPHLGIIHSQQLDIQQQRAVGRDVEGQPVGVAPRHRLVAKRQLCGSGALNGPGSAPWVQNTAPARKRRHIEAGKRTRATLRKRSGPTWWDDNASLPAVAHGRDGAATQHRHIQPLEHLAGPSLQAHAVLL